MMVLTTDGLHVLDDLGRSEASAVGSHWNAVQAFLETGNERALSGFLGVHVGRFTLETDAMAIYVLAHQGELAFDDLYGDGGEW